MFNKQSEENSPVLQKMHAGYIPSVRALAIRRERCREEEFEEQFQDHLDTRDVLLNA